MWVSTMARSHDSTTITFQTELCDRFMDSIEMITSQEREVLVKDKESGKNKVIMAKVWNKTVANLTLMALGSSGVELCDAIFNFIFCII